MPHYARPRTTLWTVPDRRERARHWTMADRHNGDTPQLSDNGSSEIDGWLTSLIEKPPMIIVDGL